MKIKKFLVILGSLFSITLCAGNIFASYIVKDEATKNGITISIEAPNRQFYLKAGVWDADGAVFFARFFSGANTYDVQMTPCVSEGYYQCEASILYKKVVFARVASGTTSVDWDNDSYWNKTIDFTISNSVDTYEITGWGDGTIAASNEITHICNELVRYEVVTEATVSECAVKNRIIYCGICGKISSTTQFVDHEQLTEHAAIAATCSVDGNILYYSCDHCDKYFSDENGENEITDKSSVILNATGHSFTNQYGSDATNHWLICDHDCGATDTPEAHTFVNGVCSVCGYVQAHAHSYVNHPAVAATCTSGGNEQYYTCSGCDKIFDSNHNEIQSIPTIATLGHNYVNHECTRCGDIETGYTKVTFKVNVDVGWGNSVVIVGTFNNWSTDSNYIELSYDNGAWVGTVIWENGNYLFKSYVRGSNKWENGANHTENPSGGTVKYEWNPTYPN